MSMVGFIAVLLVATGSIGLTWAVFQVFEARDSARWPKTIATITHSWVSRKEDAEGELFEANVTYQYFVEGRKIIANRIRLGGRTAQSWRGPSERVVARYPVGHGVTFAYDPDDPTQGVLEPGSTRSAWTMVAISAAWTALSILVLLKAV